MEAAVAVSRALSDLEKFLLSTPDDTEDAPWMVMSGLQSRETHLLMDILRLHVAGHHLHWYLESYLKITLPRPRNEPALAAAPDLLMALTADEPRTSWDIVAERQPPRFVLEVSSPWSWHRDATEKPRIYQAMGIAEYVVFAPERHDGGPKLFGHRLDAGGQYQAWDVDAHGVLWSEELELGLYIEEDTWLRARDRYGNRLPTPTERSHAADAAREAASTARAAAEAEVARLREELRRLREGQA
jgi:hypothetical protein